MHVHKASATRKRSCRKIPVIGDGEEVPDIVEEHVVAALDAQVLAQQDDAIRSRARGWLVVELREIFGLELDVFVALFDDELLFVAWWTLSPLVLFDERPFGPPLQLAVGVRVEAVGAALQWLVGVVAEDESDAVVGPAVSVPGLRKIGIATEQDVGESATPTELHGLVEIRGSTL